VIVRILPQAEEELYQAVVWYEDREFGVGLQLIEAYELARRVIEERADRLPRLETLRTKRDIRRIFLQRFPFMIVFEVLPHEVVILAIAHFSQKPNYWAQRST
jgi:toxin ParE1/3/4